MKKWFQRIRGAIGMGLTWAVPWGVFGALFNGVGFFLFSIPPGISFVTLVASSVWSWAIAGFTVGAIFSTVLGLTEGRRRFDELSLPRFAAGGALGGFLVIGSSMALSLAFGAAQPPLALVAVWFGLATLLGAGSAAGTLAIARKADDRELLEDGADVGDVGLTEKEMHQLLGGPVVAPPS